MMVDSHSILKEIHEIPKATDTALREKTLKILAKCI